MAHFLNFFYDLIKDFVFIKKWWLQMEYQVSTPHGIFNVIQSLTYGEMIIAGLLTVIAFIFVFKVLYDVADREGFI